MMRPGQKNDDAVSESIGFIIIIAIMLTSVAIIFAIGYPVYNSYVGQSHMQNMVEGFDLVSENANNVAMLRTPYQQSELKLFDGTIALRTAGTLTIECYTADGSLSGSDTVNLNILEYSKGDSSIAYLLGGVFKKDVNSYPVIKKPLIYQYSEGGTEALFLPLVSLYDNVGDQSTLAGKTLARISFGTYYYSKRYQTVQYPDFHTYDNVQTIEITINTDQDDRNYNDEIFAYFRDEWGFGEYSDDGHRLVMIKDDFPNPITVKEVQSIVIATINKGSA